MHVVKGCKLALKAQVQLEPGSRLHIVRLAALLTPQYCTECDSLHVCAEHCSQQGLPVMKGRKLAVRAQVKLQAGLQVCHLLVGVRQLPVLSEEGVFGGLPAEQG